MSEWKEYKLGEVADISTGYAFKGDEYEFKGKLRVVRGENVTIGNLRWDSEKYWNKSTDNLGQYFLEENDIVIGMDGSRVGHNRAKIKSQELPLILAQRVAKLRAKNNFDQSFLWYHIFSDNFKDYVEAIHTGTSIPHISQRQIADFEILAPKLKTEQTAIASVLSSLDDKIDLLHRQNATLEKMAETLFRQWFVEEAKEEWEIGKVSDLIKILSGFAFKSSSFVESGKYRLITIKGVQDGYLELNNADKIEELPERMPDFCKLQMGDILLSLTGNVGRCCLVDTTDLLLNQRVAKLHPINERDRAYTYFLFRQPQIKQLLEEMGKGTAQSNLSPIETSNMELIIPDKEKLTEFSAIATPWLNKLLFNKKAIQTLSNLRDSLLPKLMSGEVTVEMK